MNLEIGQLENLVNSLYLTKFIEEALMKILNFIEKLIYQDLNC